MSGYFLNTSARERERAGMFNAEEYDQVASFYDSRPDIEPTPLRRLSALAAEIGIGELMVKDESSRFGLPAFKVMGALYAVNRYLSEGRIGRDATLVCATSGNHGRAVARVARDCGLQARIYVPLDAVPWRINAIAGEGADVVVTDGGYENAVRRAARDAKQEGWQVISDDTKQEGWQVISDTSFPNYYGYDEIPRLIMAGYTRLMDEASREWDSPPDVVLVQGGVGGLVCAMVSWLAWRFGSKRPYFICCESVNAACLLESARAGAPVVIEGPLETKMEGLRCAEVSTVAWPVIAKTVDAFVAIDDERSFQTMRRLAHPRSGDPKITAGASGACGLATLIAILEEEELRPVCEASGLNQQSRVMVFNTEGATDPELYARVTEQA